jgi:hypothetical protein
MLGGLDLLQNLVDIRVFGNEWRIKPLRVWDRFFIPSRLSLFGLTVALRV